MQKFVGEVDLPLADLRAFADVEAMRHEFEIGEDFVEGRGDRWEGYVSYSASAGNPQVISHNVFLGVGVKF